MAHPQELSAVISVSQIITQSHAHINNCVLNAISQRCDILV